MHRILIVRRTSPTTAVIEPSEFQSDSKAAVKGFVKEFNRLELTNPRGMWAVLSPVVDVDEPTDEAQGPIGEAIGGDGLVDDMMQEPGVYPF